jgi:hypothetical protein
MTAVIPRRERELQAAILALLHVRGVVCWKAGSGAFRVPTADGRARYVKMGHPGVADIIGILPWTDHGHRPLVGRFLAIEVKRPGQDATPAQAAFLASVREAGGLAFVAHSVDEVATGLGWTP